MEGFEVTIRVAEERDVPRLLALLQQVNNVHHAIRPELFVRDGTKYEGDTLKAMLHKTEAPIFVAEDAAGFVCGYLFAVVRELRLPNYTGGRSLYVDDLCVDETCRGRGVGRRLLAHAQACAKALGCRELTLTVWEGNDAALQFYRGAGFRLRSRLLELTLE